MARTYTYYDNLKVARDAPDAVIRAAYKALAQQWHPDRNVDIAESTRVMKLINEAYAVLSDANRRREHDLWIAHQEAPQGQWAPTPTPHRSAASNAPPPDTTAARRRPGHGPDDPHDASKAFKWIGGLFALGMAVNALVDHGRRAHPEETPTRLVSSRQVPPPAPPPGQERFESFDNRPPGWRATEAGNGEATAPRSVAGSPRELDGSDVDWQAVSRYVPGAQLKATGGRSTFAVDNAGGERDAVVRLYLGAKKPAVRTFYVKRGGSFTATSLSPGTYLMRYRYLGSSDTFEAGRQFQLAEASSEGQRRFSAVKVTLFRERNGNLSTKKVPAEEF